MPRHLALFRSRPCYFPGMKQHQNRKEASVTDPLLKDLLKRQLADSKQANPKVAVGSTPLAPPDLYQDAGGGYNPDFTFPQE